MLSVEQFKNLCHLARLDPEDKSLQNLQNDFNRILDYVESIQTVDTSMADDSIHTSEQGNVVRPDQSKDTLTPEQIATFAPQWESGHFVVPAVIDAE